MTRTGPTEQRQSPNPTEGDVRGHVPISSHSEVTVHLSPPPVSTGGSMSAEVGKPKAICISISIPLRWGLGRLLHRPHSATSSAVLPWQVSYVGNPGMGERRKKRGEGSRSN
ncbi:hypothetical protein Q8A73_022120 [Channa argus]|nr:hypothetical protein Q8A73_022120 [Channa argus]